MTKPMHALATTALLALAANAHAVTITFDNLAVNSVLSTQYAGVVFSPNAFTGPGGPQADWATNTNLVVVSSTGQDIGDLGGPSLVSGNIVRSFNQWLIENGDPSFRVSFASAINSFSADFAGVSTPADVRLFAYDGATLLGTVAATTTGQLTLSFAAPRITSVIVTPGDFDDWVGFDNIRYTPAVSAIPEPDTYALMGLGLGVVAWARRRTNTAKRDA